MFDSQYKNKLITPEKAVEMIPEGGSLIHGMCMAEPPALLGAAAARLRAGDLKRIQVHSLLPVQYAMDTVLATDLSDCVDACSWFVSSGERGKVGVGLFQFVPNHFHQVPRLLCDHYELDLCVTTVSPMDEHGYFSFGTSNDFTSTVARHADKLVVEVNSHMPRVFGESLLHISEVDGVVENHLPLLEMPPVPITPEDEKIGAAISQMVPDGACIQIGAGAVPNAVCAALEGHKDLGIHTEVLGPGLAELVKKGVITGARKNLHPRKHLFTVAQGDRAMLDFMDNNPAVESYPVSYTNLPSLIARNENMISVNAVIQVDLFGQANAEYLAGHQFSGTGGQLDFVRGAYESPGGQIHPGLPFHGQGRLSLPSCAPIAPGGRGHNPPHGRPLAGDRVWSGQS